MDQIDTDSLKAELPDRYQVESVLGQGGIGVVFRAKDLFLGKDVAVKTLLSRLSGKQIVRFHSEARVLARLSHPNILTALDFQITESGMPFLVLDYIEGEDLEEKIEREGALPWSDSLPMFIQLVDALAYAHSKGVVHRDIKPSNVMLVKGERGTTVPKILDFGLSKMSASEEEQKLTATGALLGSPLYMSPEQAKGKEAAVPSDVYSLGALFYKVLTGRPPVEGENYLETLQLKLAGEIPDLKEIAGDEEHEFPERLQAVLNRCLALDPQERYQTMGNLKQSLLSIEDPEVEETVASEIKDAPGPNGAKGFLVASLVLVAFVLLFVLIPFMVRGGNESFRKVGEDSTASGSTVSKNVVAADSEEILKKAYEERRFKVDFKPGKGYLVTAIGAVDDDYLSNIKKYDGVYRLKLEDCLVTGRGLKFLSEQKNLKSLGVLHLTGSRINSEDLAYLAEFPNLKELDLSQCTSLINPDYGYLRACKLLKILRLQFLTLSRENCRTIASLENLDNLDLRYSRGLTPEAMEEFQNSKSITRLEVGGTGGAEDAFIDSATMRALPSFKVLRSILIEKMDGRILSSGLRGYDKFPGLFFIDFRDCTNLPANLGTNLNQVKSLKSLRISSCRLDKNRPLTFLTGLSNLGGLDLYSIDLEGMGGELGSLKSKYGMKSLKRLNLDYSAEKELSFIRRNLPGVLVLCGED